VNKRVSRRRRLLRKKKIDAISVERTEAEIRRIYLSAHPLAQAPKLELKLSSEDKQFIDEWLQKYIGKGVSQ
jgi:hypothetical protein